MSRWWSPDSGPILRWPLLVIGAGLAFAIVVAAIQTFGRPRPAEVFAPGRCVTYENFGDRGDSMSQADCDGAHTHMVVDFVADQSQCPPDADARFWGESGIYCLRRDVAPSAAP